MFHTAIVKSPPFPSPFPPLPRPDITVVGGSSVVGYAVQTTNCDDNRPTRVYIARGELRGGADLLPGRGPAFADGRTVLRAAYELITRSATTATRSCRASRGRARMRAAHQSAPSSQRYKYFSFGGDAHTFEQSEQL